MAWYGKISEINIWKEDSKNTKLLNSRRKQVQGISRMITFYMGAQLLNTDVEMLNLSVRSSNCLRRANWNTIGDILNNIERWTDLKSIRNLGNNSAVEIITKLEDYQDKLLTGGGTRESKGLRTESRCDIM